MAEKIDVFSTPYGKGARFTVNTAVNSVDLDSVTGNPEKMLAGAGVGLLADGDCFEILSCGFIMPENFVLSQYSTAAGGTLLQPVMFLNMEVPAGPVSPIEPFGNNGQQRIPFENYEMSIGSFVDPVKLGVTGGAFQINCRFPLEVNIGDLPQVSMINVPAALNGEIFDVTPFIKIRHNFNLT